MRIGNALAAMVVCVAILVWQPRPAAAAEAFVSLPYNTSDAAGNQWTVFQNGMLQQRGAQPVYGQGAILLINGEPLQSPGSRAHLDDETGELVLENFSAAGMTVTRRILIKADDAYVRYIDLITNATAADQTLDLQLQSRINFGLTASQTVADPSMKDRVLGWLGQTQINRTAVELLAGRSAKNAFSIAQQPENNMMQADMTLKIPARGTAAVMHIHCLAPSIDAALQLVTGWKEAKLLKNVPAEIRKALVNFGSGQSSFGNVEVLRGDLLDVVELRNATGAANQPGDQLKGTLKELAYKLHTFYGDFELPADRVVALVNVGAYRPRQLLLTSDGQVFGGELAKETIALELSSGQVTQIPLAQIARLGYRKRDGDKDDDSGDTPGDRPMIFLRTGDRLSIQPPAAPIEFMTRYGMIKLDPKVIAAIAFQSDDSAVHTAYLNDGSHIAGLVAGEPFKMALSAAGTTQPAGAQEVTIPSALLQRWQFGGKTPQPDADAPTIKLANGDLFVGTLTGQLKLGTLFDTIAVNASEIHSLTHAADAGSDVQIELWDQTRLSGSLADPQLQCALTSGENVQTPLELVESYSQPQPKPSAMMVEQIKSVVANLAADDWQQRDQAQRELVAMGPMVGGILKDLSRSAPPEAQQRIEVVLKQFADKKKPGG